MTSVANLPGEGGHIDLRLDDHNICFVLPAGATMTAGSLNLPGGALLQGRFEGKIVCKRGSVIIAETGEFAGRAEAERIYVAGRILQPPTGDRTSVLVGTHLVAISKQAHGRANLASRAFAIHNAGFEGQFKVLRD